MPHRLSDLSGAPCNEVKPYQGFQTPRKSGGVTSVASVSGVA